MFELIVLIGSMLAVFSGGPCRANEIEQRSHQSRSFQEIKKVTRQLLLKEIELERFNIDYRRHASVQGRWRGPRYYLSQAGNNAATMAGLFDAVAIREDERPSRIALENSFVPQMVGQFVAAGGSATELLVNKYHDRQARSLSLDSKGALRRARRFKEEIRTLLKERGRLIDGAVSTGSLSKKDTELLQAEELVLIDLTRISLHEFVKFYVGARRFRWFQDSLYVVDIAKNVVGAAGNIVAIEGLKRGKPPYAGHAGVLVLTSGALIAINPIFSRGVGKVAGMLSRRQCRDLVLDDATTDEIDLDQHLDAFARALGAASDETELSAELKEILDVHQEQCDLFKKKNEMAVRELRQGTRAATENVLAGFVVGSTKVTLGILAMVAGYHHHHRPRHANQLLEDGSIVYGIGNAFGLADNTRIQIRNEYERHKLKKERLLPAQILEDHLNSLDRIEKTLTGEVLGR